MPTTGWGLSDGWGRTGGRGLSCSQLISRSCRGRKGPPGIGTLGSCPGSTQPVVPHDSLPGAQFITALGGGGDSDAPSGTQVRQGAPPIPANTPCLGGAWLVSLGPPCVAVAGTAAMTMNQWWEAHPQPQLLPRAPGQQWGPPVAPGALLFAAPASAPSTCPAEACGQERLCCYPSAAAPSGTASLGSHGYERKEVQGAPLSQGLLLGWNPPSAPTMIAS